MRAPLTLLVALVMGGCGSTAPDEATTPVLRHRLVVGSEADIVARRQAILPHHSFGVKAPALAAPHSRFIRSSGSIVAHAKIHREVLVSLVRSESAAAGLAVGAAESSDETVATVQTANGELRVALTGKLGNAYITAFDGVGSATAKFMVLSAVPREGTAIIDDEELQPTSLFAGASGQTLVVATDFVDRTSDVLFNRLYEASPDATTRVGAMAFRDDATLGRVVDRVRSSTGGRPRAVYFPRRDLLVTLVNGDLGAECASGQCSLNIAAAVSQADFAKFVDYGGTLSASPLHDAEQSEGGALSFNVGTSALSELRPQTVAVVTPEGRRVPASDASYAVEEARAVRKIVAYPQQGEPLGEALACETEKSAGPISWKSLFSAAETKISASAAWNDGRPSIGIALRPHLRVGGQVGIEARAEAKCEKTLLTVPLAEWGVPLFGNVALNMPLKIVFAVKADGSLTIMTPRVELGSTADPSKPGTLGFSYKVGGGFDGTSDVRLGTAYTTLGAVAGSPQGKSTIEITSGIAASLQLEASVRAWIVRESVRAELGDVVFGLKDTAALTVKLASFDASNEFKLGVFPKLSPTLHFDTPFFKKSYQLFTVDLGEYVPFPRPKETTTDAKLFSAETPGEMSGIRYTQSSDRIEIIGQKPIAAVYWEFGSSPDGVWRGFVDVGDLPFTDATINTTGANLAQLAREIAARNNSEEARRAPLLRLSIEGDGWYLRLPIPE